MNTNFDIIIIGAGPGGYVGAIRAAQNGMKVALIEKNSLGGVCLNSGCIPTKSLLNSAQLFNKINNAKELGIKVKDVSFSLEEMINNAKKSISQLSSGIKYLLQKHKVEVIYGHASLSGKKVIVRKDSTEKATQQITAKHIILATGSRPKQIPGLEFDGKLILSSKDTIFNTKLPTKLCIIGAGAIGIEFASIYNALGTQVTVLEKQDSILSIEDNEVKEYMHQTLSNKGIKIITKANITNVNKEKDSITVNFESSGKNKSESFCMALVAVGISQNIEDLGLETTKVKHTKGVIEVNKQYETHEKGIYAIGDLTPGPWLAHKASIEALRCIDYINNKTVMDLSFDRIPSCVYSFPEVASIGLTEKEAINKGYKVKIGKSTFLSNGKALISGNQDGFVKTIFNAETGEVLGTHMVGDGVCELIHSISLAMEVQITELDILNTVYPHPTKSELLQESVLNAYSIGIHS